MKLKNSSLFSQICKGVEKIAEKDMEAEVRGDRETAVVLVEEHIARGLARLVLRGLKLVGYACFLLCNFFSFGILSQSLCRSGAYKSVTIGSFADFQGKAQIQ
ncbi:hypothetical protein EV2_039027 [Malus domestica]